MPGKLAALAESGAAARWFASLYAKDWVVYAKRPFGGPAQVLKYLARYTHRVAISNSRLMKLQDGHVTFRYIRPIVNGVIPDSTFVLTPAPGATLINLSFDDGSAFSNAS